MIAAALSLVLLTPTKEPKWLDQSIAGYVLQYDEKHAAGCFHDAKSGFYVLRNVECDGSHLDLIFTRDRKLVTTYSYKVKHLPKALGDNGVMDVSEAQFKTLATGKGVKIGDMQASVRTKFGKPTKVELAGNRKQFREWKYQWRNVQKGVGAEWENTYVFKAGKLVEVRFHRDSVPGCGDEE